MERRDEPSRRAAGRASWPVRSYSLGEEPPGAPGGTPAECVAMMWPLACEAWELAGLPLPDYSREDVPGRMLRGGRAR